MKIVGRDSINASHNSKVIIDNSQPKDQNWIHTIVITIVCGLILAGIVYWLGWN